ncbi:MAG: tetratricopeptide repeat protein [Microcoleaceae cyanobacterium]
MKSTSTHQQELKHLYQKGDRLYSIGKLETALKTFQKALEITRLINSNELRLDIVYRLGLVHCRIGEYVNALKYLDLALELAKKIKNDTKIATIYNEKGETYRFLGENSSALQCYSQALKIFRKQQDTVGIGKTLNHISTIYNRLELSAKSLNCARKSLNIFQKLRQSGKIDTIASQINESTALHNMGEAYLLLLRPRQAQAFLEMALEMRKKLWQDSLERLTFSLDYINELSQNQDNGNIYPKKQATYKHEQNDGFHKSIVAQYGTDLLTTMNLMEKVYKSLGQQQQADNYHQQALEIGTKVNNHSWCLIG